MPVLLSRRFVSKPASRTEITFYLYRIIEIRFPQEILHKCFFNFNKNNKKISINHDLKDVVFPDPYRHGSLLCYPCREPS
ncbi:hypothetical protein GKA01_03990 [Gluconobacter kanchanaburiensis NBRC 103587]|uniref:Uncharacterized protein n=1 Tax=Gluconobacter kanchanaburiensis NBRC 103587 TaxID=1307948 RepID=A0A511B674_9PROT|nr:hypothetical protein AA103587_0053 [Gluconobacter kanchanaburiensis NBRC 103587]GEK95202.1 hypothetical protein GKA01_03990 [Gluconobacter kanchanaburiensis NBRC 103587]